MPRSFLVDEDLPERLASVLTSTGIRAVHVRDVGLTSHGDDQVYRYAVDEGFALITRDVEFGNVLLFPLAGHHGIVLVRIPTQVPSDRASARIIHALRLLADDDITGNVVVIDEQKVRVRRKP